MASEIERIGTIVDWNDARGFGFIVGAGVRGRVFFHAKDVAGSVRPKVGDEVAYELVSGRLGRPAARGVFLTGSRASVVEDTDEREDAPMRVTVRIVGALVVATAVVCCVAFGRAPPWLATCYLVGAGISFSAYWLDKRQHAAAHGEPAKKLSTSSTSPLALPAACWLRASCATRAAS